MGVKIHKIEVRGENLRLRAEIEKKSDYRLLQAIFRDCISARLSIDSSFGLDEDFKEKNVLRYPVDTVFDLIYDSENRRVGITWKGPTEEKNAVP